MSDRSQIFLQGSCELVGAGGAFEAALNAGEALDGFFGGHADDQSSHTLGVAGAAAMEGHFPDDMTVIQRDVDRAGTNTVRLIGKRMHKKIS